jgi:hypothetical protein
VEKLDRVHKDGESRLPAAACAAAAAAAALTSSLQPFYMSRLNAVECFLHKHPSHDFV